MIKKDEDATKSSGIKTMSNEPEVYKIENLNDLFNCPTNLIEQCLSGIKDIFKDKLELELKKGKDIKLTVKYFHIRDDGDDTTYTRFDEPTS